MRFTMMILGPSVLLTVKMCIRRRQKMIKASDSMMRPGYKVDGINLGTQERKGNISVLPVWGFFSDLTALHFCKISELPQSAG